MSDSSARTEERVEKRVEEVECSSAEGLPEQIFATPEPKILKGLVSRWPAVAAARKGEAALMDYLRQCCQADIEVAVRESDDADGLYHYNDDLSGRNFRDVAMPMTEFLSRLQNRADGSPHIYMGTAPISKCLPGFRAENDIGLNEGAAVYAWIGSASLVPAHYDVPDNIACVVSGRRRFTVFPPEQLANLYVGPLDFTPMGQPASLVDFAAPDFERHPRYRQALQAAQVAELEPGDALYIPSMWWHHVEAPGDCNALINYWWVREGASTGNPIYALMHALLNIRGLPPEQKQAWRGMFEYFLFSDEDTLAHIPERRLGVLGPMDDIAARELRTMLREQLKIQNKFFRQ